MDQNSFLTGSGEIVSSLHFLDTGELVIENIESTMTPDETSTLVLTQEYLLYALDRGDWMMTFLEIMRKNTDEEISKQKPRFEIIQGGLSDST